MRLKTIIVGLVVFLVLSGVGLWLANRKGMLPNYVQLRTYMDDASGLTDGTKVRIDGIPIGYLDHQHLTGAAGRQRRVEFEMKVKYSYLEKIPVDSKVGVVADNLLSDKAIDITPGHSAEHVQPGAELQSAQAVDPNKMMAQMGNTLQDFQKVVDRANNVLSSVDAGSGSIGKMKNNWQGNWNSIPVEARKLMTDYTNSNGTLRKLLVDNDEINGEVQTTQKRFDDVMGGLQAGQGTAGKIADLQKDLNLIIQEANQLQVDYKSRTAGITDLQQKLDNLMGRFAAIADKINAGQGSLGQFLVNPQLSEALQGTTTQFQGFMKDARANPKKFLSFKLGLF